MPKGSGHVHVLIIALALAIGAGCLNRRPPRNQDSWPAWRTENPNIRIYLSDADPGVDSINIKRGRDSFLNYAFGTPNLYVLRTTVRDKDYKEFRDLCIKVLRNPPLKTNAEHVVVISLGLVGEEIGLNGLKANHCVFTFQAGQSEHVDKLVRLTLDLLDSQRKK